MFKQYRTLILISFVTVFVSGLSPLVAMDPTTAFNLAEAAIAKAFPGDVPSQEVVRAQVFELLAENICQDINTEEEFQQLLKNLIIDRENYLSEELAKKLDGVAGDRDDTPTTDAVSEIPDDEQDADLKEAIRLSLLDIPTTTFNKRKQTDGDDDEQPLAKKSKVALKCPICLETCKKPYKLHITAQGIIHAMCQDCALTTFSLCSCKEESGASYQFEGMELRDVVKTTNCLHCKPTCPICRVELNKNTLKKDLNIRS